MASISSLLWFVLPALLSAFLVLALIGPARHVGLIDHPVGRLRAEQQMIEPQAEAQLAPLGTTVKALLRALMKMMTNRFFV